MIRNAAYHEQDFSEMDYSYEIYSDCFLCISLDIFQGTKANILISLISLIFTFEEGNRSFFYSHT